MTWSLEISTFTKLPTNSNGYHIWKPLDKASFIAVFLHSLLHRDGKNKEETNVQNLGDREDGKGWECLDMQEERKVEENQGRHSPSNKIVKFVSMWGSQTKLIDI